MQYPDWRGNVISSMDMKLAAEEYSSLFYDMHRADLHKALYDRAVNLRSTITRRLPSHGRALRRRKQLCLCDHQVHHEGYLGVQISL